MNLANNLKKIRKENNLSQEEIAEMLGVSRQSVSKWESGAAYPEMEKMVQLCNLFHLNIDDLLNQDINEVNNTKRAKNTVNKFVDDFLNYVTKTVDMFSQMNFKSKVKCLIEQVIIITVFWTLFLLFGAFFEDFIVRKLFSFLSRDIFISIVDILGAIYIIGCFIIGTILVLHIFKTRYLDYYEIVKVEDGDIDKEVDSPKGVDKEDKKEKVYLEKKQEKIVIRDPKHSEYRFIQSLVKVFLFFVKAFVFLFGCSFCFSMIFFVVLLVMSFLFLKTGLLFCGALLILLSCILVNYIVLKVLYAFVFTSNVKKNRLALLFFSSLIFCGIGIGLVFIDITNFNVIPYDEHLYVTNEYVIEMVDDLVIKGNMSIEYVETNDTNIKVVTKISPYDKVNINHYDNVYSYYVYPDSSDILFMERIRDIIQNINNHKITLYEGKMIIYCNKDNYNKIKSNVNRYYRNSSYYY